VLGLVDQAEDLEGPQRLVDLEVGKEDLLAELLHRPTFGG